MPNSETKKTKLVPKQKSWYLLAFITILLTTFVISGFVLFAKTVNNTDYLDAKIGEQNYKLELANTDARRMKGLSERDGLEPNTGMLFDFKQDGDWRMWMIQMRFAIDIAWLNADKQIIYIKANAKPADFPEKYRAPELSRYVIELNSGEFEKQRVKAGDYIDINYP